VRQAHPTERAVGIAWYVSDAAGVGGRLRRDPDAFRVRELPRLDVRPVESDPGDYGQLVCRVTLRGWDTNDFAAALSNAMGISRERVSWAGTKDKHATTTQLFSISEATPEALPSLSNATIEPVGRYGRRLQFGDLAGNAFEVRVTDPERPEQAPAVTADLTALGGADDGAAVRTDDGGLAHEARVGVPNYFGHQRFGSTRPVTHEVGHRIVRREWREALLAYAGNPHEAEPDETRRARAIVDEEAASEDPDWGRALEAMPGYLGFERSMLHRLAEGTGFREAIEAVPANLQRLFVNAAQSHAFNRIVSRRLDRGLPLDRPVTGDVVCFLDRDAPDDVAVPDADRTQRVTADRVDTVARHCERGRAFVTAPLVGTDTELGAGEPGEVERAVLDELGIEPADFELPGEFNSTGTRRAVLVRTDLRVDANPLTLSFALPPGSYATVLLREYLKVGSERL
jgi:tRNA pseudouridine13 synthase